MLFSAADNRNPDSLASRLRRKRMSRFVELLLQFKEPVRVLDIGGTPSFWQSNSPDMPMRVDITLLNIDPLPPTNLPHLVFVAGDARKMPFVDGAFDVCFSNSVIEHVGTLYDQIAMAKEVSRVGKTYFVQTPNRSFPLEPHFLFPLWQFLPAGFRAWLHRRFRLGWMPRETDPLRARADVDQIRLLSGTEMRLLFVDGIVLPERLGPFVKSYTAIRSSPSDARP